MSDEDFYCNNDIDVGKELSDYTDVKELADKICLESRINDESNQSSAKVKSKDQEEVFLDPLAVCSAQIAGVEEHSLLKSDSKSSRKMRRRIKKLEEPVARKTSRQDRLLIKNKQTCKIKKHICSTCKKIFTQKCNLDAHLRTHTGEKPYTCEVCKKSFSQKRNLDSHVLIHSGQKPYVCNICQRGFSQKGNLDCHKLIHTGERPYLCNECGKSFTRKPGFVRHRRIHTGYKPYECKLCGKVFTHKTTLTDHESLHTGEKPFSCHVCNKSFACKSYYNRHKKIHRT